MLLAMGPLVVLFELSVALARVFEKRRILEPDDWEWEDEEDEDDDEDGERPEAPLS
jgi:Sec-independent protein secretion pathway component TatC